MKIQIKKVVLSALFLSLLSVNLSTYAKTQMEFADDHQLSRAEATSMIVRELDLKNKNADFLSNCEENIDYCLFDFTARSNFSELSIEPLILYPDVYPAFSFYDEINIATKLGLVSGYYLKEESPFLPMRPITNAEALKIALMAAEKVEWRWEFEIENELPVLIASLSELLGEESEARFLKKGEWWKVRFLTFALQNGLIEESVALKADEPVNAGTLKDWLNELK